MLAAVEDAVMTDLEELKLEAEAILSLRVKQSASFMAVVPRMLVAVNLAMTRRRVSTSRSAMKGSQGSPGNSDKTHNEFYRNAALHSAFDFA